MYEIMFNHKGNWIYSYKAENIPSLNEFTVVDFSDIHYMVTRIVFQPKQTRYKVFLERI